MGGFEFDAHACLASGDEPRRREQAGRYRLFAEIGTGGMATVYLGRLIGTVDFARTVAVKRALPSFARDATFRRMVVDEARIASRIHHPNVVATLDVVAHRHELLVVMEYVHGVSLSTLMRLAIERGEVVPLDVGASLIVDVLRGLDAVHRARDERGRPLHLVHGDVSPQNILVGADGMARLADFGLSRAAGDASSSSPRDFRGKLTYASPEQVALRPSTPSSDLFSVGIVMWELLVGERMHVGLEPSQIVARLLGGSWPCVAERADDVPPPLAAVVDRALRRDPANRYPSASAMIEAIEGAVPLASIGRVSAWIGDVAADVLEARRRLVQDAERSTASKIAIGRRQSDYEALMGPPSSDRPSAEAEQQSRSAPARTADRGALRLRLLAVGLGIWGAVVVSSWTFPRTTTTFSSRLAPPGRALAAATLRTALAVVLPTSATVVPTRSTTEVGAPVASDEPIAQHGPLAAASSGPHAPSARLTSKAATPGRAAPSASAGLGRRPSEGSPSHDRRAASDCSPPFSLDEQGIRRMKAGCQ